MAKRRDFSFVIGNFDASLDKWQGYLDRVKIDTPYAKAARLHVERSRQWLKPFLDNPDYLKHIYDGKVVKNLNEAAAIVGKPSRRHDTIVLTGSAIDKAMGGTYKIFLSSDVYSSFKKLDYAIGEPLTYRNALRSFLPGDEDIPTDDDESSDDNKSSGGSKGGSIV